MSGDTVRLSVDCSPAERQQIKVLCALKGCTISDWVMDCVKERLKEEAERALRKKLPNKKKKYASVEELFQR